MNCAECQDLLLDLAYGELEPARAAEVAAHVAGCERCGPELAKLQGTRRLVAPLAAVEEPGPAFDAKILAAARAEAAALAPAIAPAVDAAQSGGTVRSLEEARLRRRGRWMRVAVAASFAAAAGLSVVVSTNLAKRESLEEAGAPRAAPQAKVAPAEPARSDQPATAEREGQQKQARAAEDQRLAQLAEQATRAEPKAVPDNPASPPEGPGPRKESPSPMKDTAPTKAKKPGSRDRQGDALVSLDDGFTAGPPSVGDSQNLRGPGGSAAGSTGGPGGSAAGAGSVGALALIGRLGQVKPTLSPAGTGAGDKKAAEKRASVNGGSSAGGKGVSHQAALDNATSAEAAPEPTATSPKAEDAAHAPSKTAQPAVADMDFAPPPPPAARPFAPPAAAAQVPAAPALAKAAAAPEPPRSRRAAAERPTPDDPASLERRAAATADAALAAGLWRRAAALRRDGGDVEGAASDFAKAIDRLAAAGLLTDAQTAQRELAALSPSQTAAVAEGQRAVDRARGKRSKAASKPGDAAPAEQQVDF